MDVDAETQPAPSLTLRNPAATPAAAARLAEAEGFLLEVSRSAHDAHEWEKNADEKARQVLSQHRMSVSPLTLKRREPSSQHIFKFYFEGIPSPEAPILSFSGVNGVFIRPARTNSNDGLTSVIWPEASYDETLEHSERVQGRVVMGRLGDFGIVVPKKDEVKAWETVGKAERAGEASYRLTGLPTTCTPEDLVSAISQTGRHIRGRSTRRETAPGGTHTHTLLVAMHAQPPPPPSFTFGEHVIVCTPAIHAKFPPHKKNTTSQTQKGGKGRGRGKGYQSPGAKGQGGGRGGAKSGEGGKQAHSASLPMGVGLGQNATSPKTVGGDGNENMGGKGSGKGNKGGKGKGSVPATGPSVWDARFSDLEKRVEALSTNQENLASQLRVGLAEGFEQISQGLSLSLEKLLPKSTRPGKKGGAKLSVDTNIGTEDDEEMTEGKTPSSKTPLPSGSPRKTPKGKRARVGEEHARNTSAKTGDSSPTARTIPGGITVRSPRSSNKGIKLVV